MVLYFPLNLITIDIGTFYHQINGWFRWGELEICSHLLNRWSTYPKLFYKSNNPIDIILVVLQRRYTFNFWCEIVMKIPWKCHTSQKPILSVLKNWRFTPQWRWRRSIFFKNDTWRQNSAHGGSNFFQMLAPRAPKTNFEFSKPTLRTWKPKVSTFRKSEPRISKKGTSAIIFYDLVSNVVFFHCRASKMLTDFLKLKLVDKPNCWGIWENFRILLCNWLFSGHRFQFCPW